MKYNAYVWSTLRSLVILLFVVVLLPTTTFAEIGGGKTPLLTKNRGCYEIENALQLFVFAAIVNGTIENQDAEPDACGRLTANIVVNRSVLNNDGTLNSGSAEFKSWTPIGTLSKPFKGRFFGGGFVISGLYFNDASETGYIGLFGYVGGAGVTDTVTISGVRLENSYFGGAISGAVGGIVGYAASPLKISNSYNKGVIQVSSNNGVYAGGLVGFAESTLILVNSYNAGRISVAKPVKGEAMPAGGLVANVSGNLTMTNCYNAAVLTGSNKDDLVGAINASATNTLTNVFFKGTSTIEGEGVTKMTAEQFANGSVALLLHYYDDGEVNGSVWGQSSFTSGSLPDFSGSFSGKTASKLTLHVSKTESQSLWYLEGFETLIPTPVKTDSAFGGWYESSDFSGKAFYAIPSDATGSKEYFAKWFAADKCARIATADDLKNYASYVNGLDGKTETCAVLTADIILNKNVLGADNANVNADGEYIGADSASFLNWTPIGTSSEHPFKGQFYGQGHTIGGLYINKPDNSCVGLFGYVDYASDGGVIDGVGLVDSYIKAESYIGGLVGFVAFGSWKISNSYNSGFVTGNDNVGGLVGESYNSSITINSSYNTASVKASGDYVGGLVGNGSLAMFNSYNAGSVSGKNGVGGFTGKSGILNTSNAYNTGAVSGEKNVGGFNGYASGSPTIVNSFNAGSVSGSENVGGFIGMFDGSVTIKNVISVGSMSNKACGIVGKASLRPSTTDNVYYREHNCSEIYGLSKTADEFADGSVALLLHNWCEKDGDNCKEGGLNGSVWGQNVGQATDNDAAPTLSGVLKFGPLTIAKDAAGKDSAAIDGASKLEMKIPAEVNVPSISFKRSFPNLSAGNAFSTIMLPFTPISVPEGVTFYEFVGASENGGKWTVSVSEATEIAANTPYLVKVAGGAESIEFAGGTFKATEGEHGVTQGNWKFVGTYEYKQWLEGNAGLGKTYGFVGAAGNAATEVGKFKKAGAGAYIFPMRAYLEYSASAGRPAANGAKPAVASLPDEIGVVIVDKDETTGEETSRVIGTLDTRTGEFKFATDRWFDLNGRYLGNKKPTQKGAYYNNGKKVIVK